MKNPLKNLVWLMLAGTLVTSLAACRITPRGSRCWEGCGPSAAPAPCAPAPVPIAQVVTVVRSAAQPGWSLIDARKAEKIEILVDHEGTFEEVEYHIKPEEVPQEIRDAMDALFPGGEFTGAEKEREGGVPYFELSREIDGFEVEAMFTLNAELHSVEKVVPEDQVPPEIKDAVAEKYPSATEVEYEEILDGDQQLVEYHVKLVQDGMHYKVVVTKGGTVQRSVREVVTELEVPVPLR